MLQKLTWSNKYVLLVPRYWKGPDLNFAWKLTMGILQTQAVIYFMNWNLKILLKAGVLEDV